MVSSVNASYCLGDGYEIFQILSHQGPKSLGPGDCGENRKPFLPLGGCLFPAWGEGRVCLGSQRRSGACGHWPTLYRLEGEVTPCNTTRNWLEGAAAYAVLAVCMLE